MFLYHEYLLYFCVVLFLGAGKVGVLACSKGASSGVLARDDQALYMRHMMQMLRDTAPEQAAAPTEAPQYDYGTDYYYATDGGPGAGAATTTPAIQTPLAPQTPMATNPPFQPQPTPAIQSTIQPLVPPNQVVYPSPQQAQPYNEVQVRPYPSYPCCPYMSPMNPCCQSFTVQVQMNNFCTLPQNCGMYG